VLAARIAPPAGDSPTADSPTAISTSPDATVTRRRSRIFRRKAHGEPFVDRPGRCVVCGTEWQADSREALAQSEWLVRDDAALCPGCRHEGWVYPPDAALPFRDAVEHQS
jgi:hypothetical protein